MSITTLVQDREVQQLKLTMHSCIVPYTTWASYSKQSNFDRVGESKMLKPNYQHISDQGRKYWQLLDS